MKDASEWAEEYAYRTHDACGIRMLVEEIQSDALESAADILDSEGWLGTSMQQIRAMKPALVPGAERGGEDRECV